MTQDEIIEMAIQVYGTEGWTDDSLAKLHTFAKLIAAKEREACAKVAYENAAYWAGYKIAAAIQARGEA